MDVPTTFGATDHFSTVGLGAPATGALQTSTGGTGALEQYGDGGQCQLTFTAGKVAIHGREGCGPGASRVPPPSTAARRYRYVDDYKPGPRIRSALWSSSRASDPGRHLNREPSCVCTKDSSRSNDHRHTRLPGRGRAEFAGDCRGRRHDLGDQELVCLRFGLWGHGRRGRCLPDLLRGRHRALEHTAKLPTATLTFSGTARRHRGGRTVTREFATLLPLEGGTAGRRGDDYRAGTRAGRGRTLFALSGSGSGTIQSLSRWTGDEERVRVRTTSCTLDYADRQAERRRCRVGGGKAVHSAPTHPHSLLGLGLLGLRAPRRRQGREGSGRRWAVQVYARSRQRRPRVCVKSSPRKARDRSQAA